MILWILRAIGSMLAGLLACVAIALLLFHFNLKALLNDELYANALAEQNAYERLYTEALTARNIEPVWAELSGGTDYLTSSDLHSLMRSVAPPEYLQAQTEANLSLLSSFATAESEELELYLEMTGPIDRIVASTVDLIIAKIQGAPLVNDPMIASLADQAAAGPYSQEIAAALEYISTGGLESYSITDLTGLSEEAALTIFDQAMASALDNDLIDQQYRDSLAEAEPRLRLAFATGDTRQLLAEATRTAAAAALEMALADFRTRLDSDGRLDLVPMLARGLGNMDEAQFQENATAWRDRIDEALAQSRNLGLTALAAASGLVALVYWGRPRHAARWFYLLLVIGGGASLLLLTIARLALPGVADRVASGAWTAGQFEAEGLIVLTVDIAISVISSRLAALMWYAGGALAVGILTWAAFLAWDIRCRKRQSAEQIPIEPDTGDETIG